jgi:cell wall-associated NlpC family hydrolase
MPARADIVAKAREFLGTPFQHQGRLKGKAMDCVGLVLCVAEELSIVDVEGNPILGAQYLNYGPQPTDRFVYDECLRRLRAKRAEEPLESGDVLSLRVPSVPCHVAIVSELQGGFGMVHAYSGGPEKVVEHVLDWKWCRRIEGVFSFPGTD